jgi:hypothetical protein
MRAIELVASVRTLDDFNTFIDVLKAEARRSTSDSNNHELVEFLGAMSRWLNDYTSGHGGSLPNQRRPETVDWNLMACLLMSGWDYE